VQWQEEERQPQRESREALPCHTHTRPSYPPPVPFAPMASNWVMGTPLGLNRSMMFLNRGGSM
jgi:hypothetical protein